MFAIKDLEIKVKFSKANVFAKKFCKGQSIIELLPTKMGEFDGEFLIEALNFFQSNEKKLSKEEIEALLDEVMEGENTEYDIPTIYCDLIKEFDYAGVFKKGMGFMIVKKFEESLKQLEKNKIEL